MGQSDRRRKKKIKRKTGKAWKIVKDEKIKRDLGKAKAQYDSRLNFIHNCMLIF